MAEETYGTNVTGRTTVEYNANSRGRKAGGYILYANMARKCFSLFFISQPEKGHTEIQGKSRQR